MAKSNARFQLSDEVYELVADVMGEQDFREAVNGTGKTHTKTLKALEKNGQKFLESIQAVEAIA